jgi:hypothetical protein
MPAPERLAMPKHPTPDTSNQTEPDPEPYFILKIGGFTITAKQVPTRAVAVLLGIASTLAPTWPFWAAK